MKPLRIGLAGILSGILLGLSYLPWSPILTAFVAIVPLLYVLPKIKALPMIAVALLANLIAFGIGDWAVWQRLGALSGTGIWLLQAAIMTLPWALGHLIYHRHNPKLGYISMVSTWLMLEWAQAQFLGTWSGIQLGMAPIWVPVLLQWYAFLGVTGGTMWILALNIQITRYLWPAEAHTRKSALYSGLAVLLLPVLISWGMWMMYAAYYEDNSDVQIAVFSPSAEFHQPELEPVFSHIILTNNDGKGQSYFKSKYPNMSILAGEGQISNTFFYQIGVDTLKVLKYKSANANFESLSSQQLLISDIMGISQRHWQLADWPGGKTGMLNNSTLLRAEAVRIYAKQGSVLICALSPPEKQDGWYLQRQQAHSVARAIELRRPVLCSTFDGELLSVKGSGAYRIMKIDRQLGALIISNSRDSFFSNYGDLIGRLSIFVSIWLALATIVKPFRKK